MLDPTPPEAPSKLVDLSFAMGLAPEAAIEYFRQKGFYFSWSWVDLWEEAHAKSFTVAKVMKLDILQDIQNAVDDAIANGTTFQTFQDHLMPLLQAKGWWGKYLDEKGKTVQLGSTYRLKTIFNANVQSAYMAGRYKTQVENAADRPYWMYVAIMDNRTRPEHALLNGLVFRFDDPFWDTHYPPLGFNCRCRVRALNSQEVKARGIQVESGTGRMVWEDRQVGKSDLTRPVCGYQDPNSGQTIFTDMGWSSNPGKTAWEPDLSQYSPDIRALADGN